MRMERPVTWNWVLLKIIWQFLELSERPLSRQDRRRRPSFLPSSPAQTSSFSVSVQITSFSSKLLHAKREIWRSLTLAFLHNYYRHSNASASSAALAQRTYISKSLQSELLSVLIFMRQRIRKRNETWKAIWISFVCCTLWPCDLSALSLPESSIFNFPKAEKM